MCNLADALDFIIEKCNIKDKDVLEKIRENKTHTGKRFLAKGVMQEVFIKAKGIRIKPFDIEYYRVENGLPNLRTGSTIICKGDQFLLISGYPELEPVKVMHNDLPDFSDLIGKDLVIQYKVDGYNTRLVYVNWLEKYVAILRGGDIDLRTTYLLWNNQKINEVLIDFFSRNRNIIINVETVGKLSLNTHHAEYYQKHYNIGDIGFFVFDMMNIENSNFLLYEEVKKLSEEYNFLTVKSVDSLDLKNADAVVHNVLDPMFKEGIYEGLVFKENSRAYTRIMKKLRLEYFKKYKTLLEKLPKKKARKKAIEEVIFEHFIQGYPEPPWLIRGIQPEETAELNKLLEKLRKAVEKNENIRNIVGEITELLLGFILRAIHSEKIRKIDKNKLEKAIKRYVGKQIGKMKKF